MKRVKSDELMPCCWPIQLGGMASC